MVRQIRLILFIIVIGWALALIPKDCVETLRWIKQVPFEK